CFQAEDGIRDKLVTGVQTCALPILSGTVRRARLGDERSRCVFPSGRQAAIGVQEQEPVAGGGGGPGMELLAAPQGRGDDDGTGEIGRASWRERAEVSVGAGSKQEKM